MAIWDHKPGWALGWGEKSPYKALLESLDRYGALRPDQADERVEALTVVGKELQRWWDHHEVDSKELENFDKSELGKIGAIDLLTDKIGREWKDLGTVVEGTLGEADDKALPDPALTKAKERQGEAKIGFFNRDASIVDASDSEIGTGRQDILCMATRKDAPEDKKPVDYWYVEPADPSLAGVEIFGDQSKVHGNFPPGYVLAAHVSIGSEVEARTDLRYSSRANQSLFPLFPRRPTPADVKQIGLGDCYLQAALMSIAKQSPDVFTSIMRDNGSTVTVRLFDIEPGDPKTFTPRRITINKSVVTYGERSRSKHIHKGDEAFSGGALWAQMMEKAYTAAGYVGGSPDTMPVGGGASYGRIESGTMNIAYEHILGEAAEMDLIRPTAYEFYQPHRKKTWLSSMEFQQAVTGPLMTEVEQRVAEEERTQSQDPEVANLMKKSQRWTNQQPQLEKDLLALHETSSQVRYHEVVAFLRKSVTDIDMADRAVQWVTAQQIYPGKRGSGVYTKEQEDLYDKIQNALHGNKRVSVGTKKSIASVAGSRGSSGGEHQAKGLAGPHGYAVLDAQTTDSIPGVTKKPVPPLKMLKLRNPWGSYGRAYHFKGAGKVLTAKETAPGEFWLALSDLTKRFNQVSIV